MATFYSVEASKSTATPTVRTEATLNGVVHEFNDYIITTSACSATGDVVKFRAGIPKGARIDLENSKIYSGAFGTGVVADFGDAADTDRFVTSGAVAAASSHAFTEAGGVVPSAPTYEVTASDYQLQATFLTSAPATGIALSVKVFYTF